MDSPVEIKIVLVGNPHAVSETRVYVGEGRDQACLGIFKTRHPDTRNTPLEKASSLAHTIQRAFRAVGFEAEIVKEPQRA